MVTTWPLSALLGSSRNVVNSRSNAPGVGDLKTMLAAFEEWRAYYLKTAKEHRERWAKLDLIKDRDAGYEKILMDSAEADASRCDVGVKVLTWAVKELGGRSPTNDLNNA